MAAEGLEVRGQGSAAADRRGAAAAQLPQKDIEDFWGGEVAYDSPLRIPCEWIIQRCTQKWRGSSLVYEDFPVPEGLLTRDQMIEVLDCVQRENPCSEFKGHRVTKCDCHTRPAECLPSSQGEAADGRAGRYAGAGTAGDAPDGAADRGEDRPPFAADGAPDFDAELVDVPERGGAVEAASLPSLAVVRGREYVAGEIPRSLAAYLENEDVLTLAIHLVFAARNLAKSVQDFVTTVHDSRIPQALRMESVRVLEIIDALQGTAGRHRTVDSAQWTADGAMADELRIGGRR